MRWTERQRAMLREIGIPAFWPVEAVPVDPADTVDAMVPVARVAPVAAVVPPAPVSAPAPAQAPALAPKASTSKTATPTAVAEAVLNPLPDGIDTMAWQPLRQAVSNCQACGLCHSRTQPVFGVGHEQADWMFVGEAPGELEDTQGEPFVDHAGQMLDRMLEAVGLMRTEGEPSSRVFITNVLKCRPPASRNPVAQEVDQCTPYLMRQIALVQPKVVVAMGRFAVQALLKSAEPIGKLRGQVHHVAGVPVVVTYHPAYLLRRPMDKALAWDDLCLAREIWAKPAADSSP